MTALILSVAITWIFVNVLKPIITWIRTREINKDTMITSGGMPSGHTSLVASLATALYLETGFSPLFLMGVVLTLVVIYDALKVRTVVESQSRIINQLTRDRPELPRLQENVGHTPAEVLVSIILSIVIPVLVYALIRG